MHLVLNNTGWRQNKAKQAKTTIAPYSKQKERQKQHRKTLGARIFKSLETCAALASAAYQPVSPVQHIDQTYVRISNII